MSIQSEIERIENNIAATYSNLEDMGADIPETQNSNNLPETVLTVKAVRYDEQSMSEAQKTQARNNIGAASSEEVSAISQEIVDYRTEVNEYKEEVNNLPNNETLLENVAEKIPFVKSPENPVFVTSEDEMTDSSKLYVYNGFIYQFGVHKEEVGGDTEVPAFTNLRNQCTVKKGYRYSLSSAAFKADSVTTSIVVPVQAGETSVVVRIKGATKQTNYPNIYGGTSDASFTDELGVTTGIDLDSDGVYTFTLAKNASITHINFHLTNDGTEYPDLIVTVNEPIEYTTKTEEVEVEGFYNTGCAFAPADYEEIILQLEKDIEELEGKIGTVDDSSAVHNAVGATYPPSQKPASADFSGYDIDILSMTADDVYFYIDDVVSSSDLVTKEILGKDASGKYDIARYVYAKREYIAWQKQNYPKMYAWKNGSTVIYSTSVSPRIGDTLYTTAYIGTSYANVTAVNATNRSRTVNGLEFVRYESGDIKPTVIYTDKDDTRNNGASITEDGATYNRYPMGDLGTNKRKLIPVFVYANEHGVIKDITADEHHEGKMPALIAARLLRDLVLGKQENNPLYKYIRENCMLIIIPVANPFGFNFNLTTDTNGYTGYYNANTVNINRNYDTPGWDYMKDNGTGSALGSYAGSEIETQYIMNTLNECGAVVAESLHGYASQDGNCAHQGQNPGNVDYNQEKLSKIQKFLKANWGYGFIYYDGEPLMNTPDITSKSPSYITQCEAYGGIVEISPDDNRTSGLKQEANKHVCENAYAQVLNVTAMWLSDYLENN